MERERFGSRLGFILISAGCAIGLGNVWRFPYITGEYGGAAFLVMYLVFLVVLGLPIMVMEFAVGRGSQRSIARAFNVLEPAGTHWHKYKWVGIAGCYLLMMFYTTVAGWMLAYVPKFASGQFVGADSQATSAVFDAMLASPVECVFWMVVVCVVSILICSLGVQKGVERITKAMMLALLAILGVLVVRALTLPGAADGVAFYLLPDFSKIFGSPDMFFEAAYAAMGQAFFTLSIGMGSMTIFGSYIDKHRSLMGEAATIGVLDTGVALATGLIIFPACFAFGVAPDSGPGLVFITLPSVFEQMWGGQVWGTLFFVFMSFAALSTVIAVFQNMISFATDLTGCSIKKAAWVNIVVVIVLSLPCVLGFNVLSGFAPFGDGSTIMDLEDFLTSNTLLPIGSLIYLLFCTSRYGWGFKKFMAEANEGTGIKFPAWARVYVTYVLPVIMIVLFAAGYWSKFVG